MEIGRSLLPARNAIARARALSGRSTNHRSDKRARFAGTFLRLHFNDIVRRVVPGAGKVARSLKMPASRHLALARARALLLNELRRGG